MRRGPREDAGAPPGEARADRASCKASASPAHGLRPRENEQEEIFQRLADEYREFLKLVLDNADLRLLRHHGAAQDLTEEQLERRDAIFGILISLFERAYLLVYEERMARQERRRWQSWEDYMREWVRRADFRAALPTLLEGEDEEFRQYIVALARAEQGSVPPAPPALASYDEAA